MEDKYTAIMNGQEVYLHRCSECWGRVVYIDHSGAFIPAIDNGFIDIRKPVAHAFDCSCKGKF
jgi:hypothetical protein